ncbi:MAG: prepilin-type N-terminal cleavage/methylation domain-containing protein [Candidatus Brocadiaceae bacterium]|nr:prepilin-type N-terminal cleavage/methylation domain-containing protein [Candidatus Brocadiaceae bacterium]
MRGRRAFTLVEMLVATAMLAMLALGGYLALAAGTASAQKARRVGRMVAAAQAALQQMTSDVRSAVAHRDKVRLTSLDVQYEGRDADTIDFMAPCTADFFMGIGGRCEVGYFIDNDPATESQGLVRREDGTIGDDPLAGGVLRLVTPLVSEMNLDFFDGVEWVDGWSDSERFPRAVRIVIVVADPDEVEVPRRFQTTVAVPAG